MVTNLSLAVVDASYVLAFLIPDGWTTSVRKVFHAYKNGELFLMAPSILTYEVLNGLRMVVKRKRLAPERVNVLVNDFSSFPITQEPTTFVEVYEMAMQQDLTIYDAAYVWLAKSKNVPLFSLDKKLVKLTHAEIRC